MWLYTLFPQILNMSLTAAIIIGFILLARLLLKRTPKVFSYALWAVVLFRLLCPISISSGFSLLNILDTPVTATGTPQYIPSDIVHAENPQVDIPIPGISGILNENMPRGEEQLVADPLEFPMAFITLVWLCGIAAMLAHSIISLVKLRRSLVGAVLLHGNIYLADHISSPFVMGLFHPKIYLPSMIAKKEQAYIIRHEQHHIRRLDHVVKILAFAALCIHWFNPLVWLAFVLSGKDMEMSCDEAVMRKTEGDIRTDYSASLLGFATGRKIIAGTPLAFGEGSTKSRIKNVMHYKKPGPRTIAGAIAACIIIAVCFLTNPKDNPLYAPEPFGYSYSVETIVYEALQYSFSYTSDTAPQYCLTADYVLMAAEDAENWLTLGSMTGASLSRDNFDHYFQNNGGISGWREDITPGKLRRGNKKTWKLLVSDSPNSVFYYVLQQKNGDVYLAYGYHGAEDEAEPSFASSIRWLFKLNKQCTVHTSGGYAKAKWYSDGRFDFKYDTLPSVSVYDSDTLLFEVGWDCDTLVVGEDYYEYPDETTGICKKETYRLHKNSDGKFPLDVSRRNNIRDEMAVYYILYGDGKYVIKVLFPVDEASASTMNGIDG